MDYVFGPFFSIRLFGLWAVNFGRGFYVIDDFGNLVRTRGPNDFFEAVHEAVL